MLFFSLQKKWFANHLLNFYMIIMLVKFQIKKNPEKSKFKQKVKPQN